MSIICASLLLFVFATVTARARIETAGKRTQRTQTGDNGFARVCGHASWGKIRNLSKSPVDDPAGRLENSVLAR
jgi:hypothetical protein